MGSSTRNVGTGKGWGAAEDGRAENTHRSPLRTGRLAAKKRIMYSLCPQQEIKDVHESEEARSDLGAPRPMLSRRHQAAVGPSSPTFVGLLLWTPGQPHQGSSGHALSFKTSSFSTCLSRVPAPSELMPSLACKGLPCQHAPWAGEKPVPW